jgi:hypothetical protein
MMQKQFLILLLSFIYFVNGDYEDSSCKRYENKIYQLTLKYPGEKSFYAGIRLLPNGQADDITSIAGGNNDQELLGASFPFSNGIGNYKCLPRNYIRATGFFYAYKTAGVDFLQDNGAAAVVDYYLSFYNNYRSCKGSFKTTFFPVGTNPFTKTVAPAFESPVGEVSCELLHFRTYYALSGV